MDKIKRLRTNRDISIITLGGIALVFAVDSAGGIGPKPLDKVKVSGEILGRFTAQAAIMEVLAVNAEPIQIAYSFCFEPQPTGDEVIKGIKRALREAKVKSKDILLGSSEKNVKVEQSGLGICVVGSVSIKKLKIGKSKKGDIIASIGIPSVGYEVLEAEEKGLIADIKTLKELIKRPYVREVIPVGSKGILYEAEIIAKDCGLEFKPYEHVSIDVKKPAGPSTVLVVSIERDSLEKLYELKKPITKIGFLD